MKKLFNRRILFIILVIISVISLAGTAAYYSVFGLSNLFAGAKIPIIIMASSLEFTKLIIASYLHNNWSGSGLLKWYLSVSLIILMLITSAGIYGYLTAAFQSTSNKMAINQKQVELIEKRIDRYESELNYLNTEKETVSNDITNLRDGLSNNTIQYKDRETGQIISTQSSANRKILSLQLEQSITYQSEINDKIDIVRDSINSLEIKKINTESDDSLAAEVGPLKYISYVTNKSINDIVNWFTLLIVVVFDPLAISMVLVLNKLLKKPNIYTVDEINGVDTNDTDSIEADNSSIVDNTTIEKDADNGKLFGEMDLSPYVTDESDGIVNPIDISKSIDVYKERLKDKVEEKHEEKQNVTTTNPNQKHVYRDIRKKQYRN